MVPGEGEHKILDMMRDGRIHGDGNHFINGMDADLIMLGLMAPLNNIYLTREDTRDVVAIDNLRGAIVDELSSGTNTSASKIQDFVVMTFLIGNDFLPHMPALEDLETAMETMFRVYRNINAPLVVDNNINWQGIAMFFTALSKEESHLLTEEALREIKYPSRFLQAASQRANIISTDNNNVNVNVNVNNVVSNTFGLGTNVTNQIKFDYNTFRGYWYHNVFSPKDDIDIFRKLMPTIDFFQITTDQLATMITEYLKGIAWVFNYYTRGPRGVNINYVYKYHHAPLLTDIALMTSSSVNVTGYLYELGQLVLNPVHQLLAVLPMKSKDLLPEEVRSLMSKDSPIADLYPLTAIIERDGKNEDWQGAVLIPFININRIIDAVNTTYFTKKRSLLFNISTDQIYHRNPELEPLIQKEREFRQMLAQQGQLIYGTKEPNSSSRNSNPIQRKSQNSQNRKNRSYQRVQPQVQGQMTNQQQQQQQQQFQRRPQNNQNRKNKTYQNQPQQLQPQPQSQQNKFIHVRRPQEGSQIRTYEKTKTPMYIPPSQPQL
jgi:5'-3' exonuclease